MDDGDGIDPQHLANNLEHYISSFVLNEIRTAFKQIPIHFTNDRSVVKHLMTPLPGNAFVLTNYHCLVSFSTLSLPGDSWHCMGHMPKKTLLVLT